MVGSGNIGLVQSGNTGGQRQSRKRKFLYFQVRYYKFDSRMIYFYLMFYNVKIPLFLVVPSKHFINDICAGIKMFHLISEGDV